MSSSSSNLSTPQTILDLPTDLLLLIISMSYMKDRRALSLVCKRFSLLYGLFIRQFTFNTLPNDDTGFTRIFTRFSSLKKIVFRYNRDVSHALTAISNSSLNLEALRLVGCPTFPDQHHMLTLSGRLKIKSLTLYWFSNAGADQIIDFIRLFPVVEELCFERDGEIWFDSCGFKRLCRKVPNLRRVDGIWSDRLTDSALQALSVHCVQLEHVGFDGYSCSGFTPEGFCAFLHRMRNLMSLELPSFSKGFEALLLPLAETVSTLEDLRHLTINRSFIKDDILCIIAKSRASLTTLKMKVDGCDWANKDYTMTGLSTLLTMFQGITRLDVGLPVTDSETSLDKKMSQLVSSLPCLKDVVIRSYCYIYSTLFSLIENCPMIECVCICIDSEIRSVRYDVPQLCRKNYSLKHLSHYPSVLRDSFKIALGSFCPNLTRWDVVFCLW